MATGIWDSTRDESGRWKSSLCHQDQMLDWNHEFSETKYKCGTTAKWWFDAYTALILGINLNTVTVLLKYKYTRLANDVYSFRCFLPPHLPISIQWLSRTWTSTIAIVVSDSCKFFWSYRLSLKRVHQKLQVSPQSLPDFNPSQSNTSLQHEMFVQQAKLRHTDSKILSGVWLWPQVNSMSKVSLQFINMK